MKGEIDRPRMTDLSRIAFGRSAYAALTPANLGQTRDGAAHDDLAQSVFLSRGRRRSGLKVNLSLIVDVTQLSWARRARTPPCPLPPESGQPLRAA